MTADHTFYRYSTAGDGHFTSLISADCPSSINIAVIAIYYYRGGAADFNHTHALLAAANGCCVQSSVSIESCSDVRIAGDDCLAISIFSAANGCNERLRTINLRNHCAVSGDGNHCTVGSILSAANTGAGAASLCMNTACVDGHFTGNVLRAANDCTRAAESGCSNRASVNDQFTARSPGYNTAQSSFRVQGTFSIDGQCSRCIQGSSVNAIYAVAIQYIGAAGFQMKGQIRGIDIHCRPFPGLNIDPVQSQVCHPFGCCKIPFCFSGRICVGNGQTAGFHDQTDAVIVVIRLEKSRCTVFQHSKGTGLQQIDNAGGTGLNSNIIRCCCRFQVDGTAGNNLCSGGSQAGRNIQNRILGNMEGTACSCHLLCKSVHRLLIGMGSVKRVIFTTVLRKEAGRCLQHKRLGQRLIQSNHRKAGRRGR